MNHRKMLTACFVALVLVACENAEERYDVGFDDGHAVGYNTTCKIRATLIEGDWDSENYSAGYQDGYEEGADECRRDGANRQ